MYLADSAAGRIDTYEVSATGEPTNPSVFVRVDEGDPDGDVVWTRILEVTGG